MHTEELCIYKPFTELVFKSSIITIMQKWNFHFLDQIGLVHTQLKKKVLSLLPESFKYKHLNVYS